MESKNHQLKVKIMIHPAGCSLKIRKKSPIFLYIFRQRMDMKNWTIPLHASMCFLTVLCISGRSGQTNIRKTFHGSFKSRNSASFSSILDPNIQWTNHQKDGITSMCFLTMFRIISRNCEMDPSNPGILPKNHEFGLQNHPFFGSFAAHLGEIWQSTRTLSKSATFVIFYKNGGIASKRPFGALGPV